MITSKQDGTATTLDRYPNIARFLESNPAPRERPNDLAFFTPRLKPKEQNDQFIAHLKRRIKERVAEAK